MIKVIGILIAIIILGIGAYRGIGPLPLTILAGLVVVVTNQMPIWQSFSEFYMNGYLGFFKDYFLIFAASALYARVMEESGSALAVGYKFIDWFGKDKVVAIIFIVTAVLTYGGVSLFVVVFAMTPIIIVLFREADIPMRFATGPLLAGSATFTMTSLPGTPQLTNVVPTTYLGTNLLAAPGFSIAISIFMFVLCYIYLNRTEKRLREEGERFSYIEGVDVDMYEVNRDELPSAFAAFLPLILLIGIILTMKNIITDSAALVVFAMLIATGVSIIFNFKKLDNFKQTFNEGLGSAVGAIAGPCAVVAFGSLVQQSSAFKATVGWVSTFNMHPYIMAVLATAIISGITGSSSGGLRITLETFADTLIKSGKNPEIIHRLMSVSAGSLDSLPHSTSLFLTFNHLGLTHKECYEFVFMTTVVIPIITTIVFTGVAILIG